MKKNKNQKEVKALEEKYIGHKTSLNLKVLELENKINADTKNKDNLKEDFEKIKLELKTQKDSNEK